VNWPVDDWWQPRRVALPDQTGLAVRLHEADRTPIVLVHGLASNALLWRDVAEGMAAEGHAVAAVDLRGHGRSDRPDGGYGTEQCAADVQAVVRTLGWTDRKPILAGQSWGGNVVVRAAAQGDGWGGLLCVDGGWIYLRDRFSSFDQCWQALAPPGFGDSPPDGVLRMIQEHLRGWPPSALAAVMGNLEVVDGRVRNRLALERHRSIVHSLWSDSPVPDFPKVTCPAHLMVAGRDSSPDVDQAQALLSDATVSWHVAAHHDIHLQHPELVIDHLKVLVSQVEGS
jgi:pimeloyl-ACP methyl ester carboxylesterase